MKTATIGPFLGINNRLPDFALQTDAGRYLRSAENVDITDAGNIVRRRAETVVQAMTAPHSLLLTSATAGYLVRASMLYAITLSPYSETLLKVLASNAPLSWVEANGDLYYSNGTDAGRISAGTVYPLALPTPTAPTIAGISGSLYAGKYQVAVSYANSATGEEGGISASYLYELVADGGLRVTLPGATSGATHVNVYVSTVNGAIPMLKATVAAGTASYDITTPATGREANQRYEAPLPAGKLFMFNGCLCSYDGANVYEGLPYRPGYYLQSEGRIPFPATVSNVVPAQNGVYVVADKTYWLAGARMTATEMIQDVLPYGGVPGTAFAIPDKAIYGWFGAKGVVIATPHGEAVAVMADAVDVTPPASGTSIILESRGYRRVLSCGWCMNLSNKAVTSYVGADFTSSSRGYGTLDDGLYLLEGSGAVSAGVSLGRENFGSEEKKRMPAVYLGCACDSPLELRVTTPDDEDYRYEARSSGATLNLHRVDPGRGLKANWFDLSIWNLDGSDFTLASVSFAPVASGRRI